MTEANLTEDPVIPHYDREMAVVVLHAIDYLATPRGQLAINRLAQQDPELHRAITVTQHHKIPWHNLGLPGWKP